MTWKKFTDAAGKAIGAAFVLALVLIGLSFLVKLLIYIWTG